MRESLELPLAPFKDTPINYSVLSNKIRLYTVRIISFSLLYKECKLLQKVYSGQSEPSGAAMALLSACWLIAGIRATRW